MKVKTVGTILLNWLPRIAVAVILTQTLFFKFTSAPESIYIFQQLGMEPWGRYGIGVIELISSLLLLSRYYLAGSIISLSVISAANFLHFAKLGIEVNNDGGTLFIMSIVVIILSVWTVYYWNNLRPLDDPQLKGSSTEDMLESDEQESIEAELSSN